MTERDDNSHYADLVRELCRFDKEQNWFEFKVNKAEPDAIGEYVSALANAAVLAGRPAAYLVWGVDDETHSIVGTTFKPRETRVGNEPLEPWLLRLLQPGLALTFHEVLIDQKHVVILEIRPPLAEPAAFRGQRYIRVDAQKRKLSDFPELERALWRAFEQVPFEKRVALTKLTEDEVLRVLDYPTYFSLVGSPLPEGRSGVIEALSNDSLIAREDSGRWSITNLGAILFARQLSDVPGLERKATRVIEYSGRDRINAKREQLFAGGYAHQFEAIVSFVISLLPTNEEIETALRKAVPMYPSIAIRELVANALVHQDFGVTGTGPTVEIFADRMEITSPGRPLVHVERFLDSPPRSRNEGLASFMRRVGICEERGSGIDKVVSLTEVFQLPAPEFAVHESSTRAVLFSPRPLSKMDKADRIRACYLHACLRYVSQDFMTNTSIRLRFGIPAGNSATASRYIREALEAGLVKPYDPGASKRQMKYVPFWA